VWLITAIHFFTYTVDGLMNRAAYKQGRLIIGISWYGSCHFRKRANKAHSLKTFVFSRV